jgi:hypothetical protein
MSTGILRASRACLAFSSPLYVCLHWQQQSGFCAFASNCIYSILAVLLCHCYDLLVHAARHAGPCLKLAADSCQHWQQRASSGPVALTTHCCCLCLFSSAGYTSRGALFKASSESLPALAAEGQLWSSGVVSGDLQPGLAWLASLLEKMSGHLDKDCFRQAWSAAAAAINRCVWCYPCSVSLCLFFCALLGFAGQLWSSGVVSSGCSHQQVKLCFCLWMRLATYRDLNEAFQQRCL